MTQTFTVDPNWLHFAAKPSRPAYTPPPGAVDAHCHVFGPAEEFPFAPERKYTPCDAGKEQLFALRDHLAFARNVIVQATCHGSDNSALVDALAASRGRARGVATVSNDVTAGELHALHDAGVRGVRFNFVRRLVEPKPDAYYRPVIERIARLGWHIVVYLEAADLQQRWDFLASLPTTVVIDHMGRPDVGKSVDGPEFATFLRLMNDNPHIWTKVTCPERLSVTGPPAYDDFVPFARRIVESFPDRVLWGTDWPHPNLTDHMPDDGALVDLIPRIAPTAQLRNKLLVDNPMRLYWGETVTDFADFDDIPGTTVFTPQRSRKGYQLNQFCMSLMKAANRERFKADERAYLDEWSMTEAQKQAVLDRDYNRAIAEGGNIYFLAKIFSTDGKSFQEAAGSMTGMSADNYAAMMAAGGRSPEGQRSVKDGR